MRRVQIAVLGAFLVGVFVGWVNDSERSSALARGDFPGFYSPAVIVARGEPQHLYNVAEHHRIQRAAWPSFGHEMYISVYPPYFSVILAPLAKLDPGAARWLWTALSLMAYLATLMILRLRSPALYSHFAFVATGSLLMAPIFYGVLGGQNTAFSMLLYVGGVTLLQRRQRLSDLAAGLLFGLWLFKPQFGVIAGIYLLLKRRWWALATYIVVGCAWWGLAAWFAGPQWVQAWLSATSSFAATNFIINDYQMTSLAGLLSSLSNMGLLSDAWVLPIAVVLSAALVLLLVIRRVRSDWILAPAMVLISPQTLFYDLSLALLSCSRFLSFQRDRDVNYFLAAIGVLGLIFIVRDYVALALPCLAALLALHFVLRHAAPEFRK